MKRVPAGLARGEIGTLLLMQHQACEHLPLLAPVMKVLFTRTMTLAAAFLLDCECQNSTELRVPGQIDAALNEGSS